MSIASGDEQFKTEACPFVDQVLQHLQKLNCNCKCADRDILVSRIYPMSRAAYEFGIRSYGEVLLEILQEGGDLEAELNSVNDYYTKTVKPMMTASSATNCTDKLYYCICNTSASDTVLLPTALEKLESYSNDTDTWSAWCVVMPLETTLELWNQRKLPLRSRLMFTIYEGHTTVTLAVVGHTKLESHWKPYSRSMINWYDARLRCSRVSSRFCRDCKLKHIFL
jgi:hypothetical protein